MKISISWPRYKNKTEKANCKLDEKQIATIRKLKKSGWKNAAIAKRFSVHPKTISYWTNEGVRRRQIELSLYRNRRNYDSKKAREYKLNVMDRKKEFGVDMRAYLNHMSDKSKLRRNLPERIRKTKNHLEELLKLEEESIKQTNE